MNDADIPRQERTSDAPDLQALVAAHGGYGAITAEAWAAYEHAVELQRMQLRDRAFVRPARSFSPSGLAAVTCVECGALGRFGYRHDGAMRWYCAKHRLAEWWADARQ